MKYLGFKTRDIYTRLTTAIERINYDAFEGFLIIVLLFFGVLFVKVEIRKANKYTSELAQYAHNSEMIEYRSGHDFIMKIGKSKLYENRIAEAYKEYAYAYKVHPFDDNTYNVLIETLSILCKDENNYCEELDDLLASNTN